MRQLLCLAIISYSTIGVDSDEIDRPVAIIPWSQYQLRMKAANGAHTNKNEERREYYVQMNPNQQPNGNLVYQPPSGNQRVPIPWSQYELHRKADKAAQTNRNEMNPNQQPKGNLVYQPPSGDQLPPRPIARQGHVTPRPRSRAIRPQIRNKVIAEPSDLMPTKVSQQKSLFVKKENTLRYPPAPNVMPHKQPGMPMLGAKTIPSQSSMYSHNHESEYSGNQRLEVARDPYNEGMEQSTANRYEPSTQQKKTLTVSDTYYKNIPKPSSHSSSVSNMLTDIRIPNGVPYHAGTWENGQPNYLPEKRPAQHGAVSVTGIDPSIPLASIVQPASGPLNGLPADNIVNSIFAQSRAAEGIAMQPVQNVQALQPNAMEAFLTNSGNLDTLAKITKNLFGAGGQESGGSSSRGLLDVMANALGGNRLPFGSAHDEFPPVSVEAARAPPQSSLMEKLLNHAATAINSSIKEKEKNDRLFEKKVNVEPEKATEETIKQSKEQEKSLKILEGLPKEQREILEQAILSKEIDPLTLGPAIGALVKEDSNEESKKEKESRLLEWIKANRPTKTADIKVTADKLPFYGRYCGSLVEQTNPTKQFRPSGAVWAVDDRRILISKFVLQPGSLLTENVTFWIGPDKATGNELMDQFPSKNGFYVHPSRISTSVFALEELPPVLAKKRLGINANVFLNGTQPISPVNVTSKVKRDTVEIIQDEKTPTYVSAPVKLLVKGGMVQVTGTDVQEANNTTRITNFTSSSSDELASILQSAPLYVPAVRVKQPEFEKMDRMGVQPLEWYDGFQPLLLTLPEGRSVSKMKWISLRDHKRNDFVATVLMPNGEGFKVPGPMAIRALSPNGIFNISSGAIYLTDMKTITITNFQLKTDGDAVWFMGGHGVLPNPTGNIIPLFDESSGISDCTSLRDYYGETITLRIPGQFDMRDIFWFAVYSPSKAVSYSVLYLPYQHLTLPPDLSGIVTSTCALQV